MSLISNLNKTLYAIKNKLLNNDELTKLLYYSVPNPLEQTNITTAQNNTVITLNPIV